jgi:hypothetical protein
VGFLNFFSGGESRRARDRSATDVSLEIVGYQFLSLTLTRVDDLADADGLWSSQHTRKGSIRERETGSAGYRLYNHLKANKHKVQHRARGRARLIGQRRVFTDVLIQINRQVWAREIRTGEPLFALLTNNIALRHQEDFRRDLREIGRRPRYVVAPSDDLHADEVRFLFGPGIFIPDEDDIQEAEITLLGPNGERERPPCWDFYDEKGRHTARPSALYAGQRNLWLRGPAGPTPIPLIARGWPVGNTGFVQLGRFANAHDWHAYDDGASLRCIDEDGEPYPGGRLYRFIGTAGQDVMSLLVEELRRQDAESSPAPTPSADTEASATETGPDPLLALRLVAYALPRIDGPHRIIRQDGTDLTGWRLWLDAGGQVVDPRQTVVDSLAMLTARAGDSRLWVRHAADSDLLSVDELPFKLHIDPERPEAALALMPPLQDAQLALLWLTHPEVLPLVLAGQPTPGPLWLGRRGGGGGTAPELALDALEKPGSLHWSRPVQAEGTLGKLGLSRQHLRLQASPQDRSVLVAPSSNGTPVSSYVLDNTLKLQRTLRPGDQAWRLQLGQYLLLGCYLMRLESPQAEDDLSEQTIISEGPAIADPDRTVVLFRPKAAG